MFTKDDWPDLLGNLADMLLPVVAAVALWWFLR